MAYNPSEETGPGNWPPVSQLTMLTPQECEVYSNDLIFSDRVHAIQTSVPLLRDTKPSGFVKWTTTLIEYKRLYPTQPGANCIQPRSFSSRVCHRQKNMRDLIALDKAVRRLFGERSSDEEMDDYDGQGSDDEEEIMPSVEMAEADNGSEVSR